MTLSNVQVYISATVLCRNVETLMEVPLIYIYSEAHSKQTHKNKGNKRFTGSKLFLQVSSLFWLRPLGDMQVNFGTQIHDSQTCLALKVYPFDMHAIIRPNGHIRAFMAYRSSVKVSQNLSKGHHMLRLMIRGLQQSCMLSFVQIDFDLCIISYSL